MKTHPRPPSALAASTPVLKPLRLAVLGAAVAALVGAGSVLRAATWLPENGTLPAGLHNWTAEGSPYVVQGTYTVPKGSTLRIQPGTVVKFIDQGQLFSGLHVIEGVIEARGTVDSPVVLTSIDDNSDVEGGVDNGSKPGLRRGCVVYVFNTQGPAIFEHVQMRYLFGIMVRNSELVITDVAARDCRHPIEARNSSVTASRLASDRADSAVMLDSCTATFDNCRIEDSVEVGIWASQSGFHLQKSAIRNNAYGIADSWQVFAGYESPLPVEIRQSSIVGNAEYGVHSVRPGPVDARYSWWGHPSGPYESSLNPTGQGNAVQNVDFTPWLEEAPDEPPTETPPPSITGISPNPVPAYEGRQWLTSHGQHFADNGIVTLRTGTETFIIPPDRTDRISSEEVRVYVNVTSTAAAWTAQISNPDGGESKEFAFNVIVADLSPGLVGWWKFDEGSGSIAHDSSGRGNHGTLVGLDPFAAWGEGVSGTALNLPGVLNSHVNVGNSSLLNPTEAITIAAWLYIRTHPAGHSIILDRQYSSSYVFYIDGFDERLVFLIDTVGDGLDGDARSHVGVIGYEEWHHVAVVYDRVEVVFYVNGNIVGREALSRPIGTDSADVWIGNESTGVTPFDGLIDDVRLYNVALTQQQIQFIMANPDAGMPPADPVLPLTLVADEPPTAQVGQEVQLTFTASGGVPPYVWSEPTFDETMTDSHTFTVSADTTTATLSFLPVRGGTFLISVAASDDLGQGCIASVSLLVGEAQTATLRITPETIPVMWQEQAYEVTFYPEGGVPPYIWSAHIDQLPDGLSLLLNSATGTLSGLANGDVSGTRWLTVTVLDGTGLSVSEVYDLRIKRLPVVVIPGIGGTWLAPDSSTTGVPPDMTPFYGWFFDVLKDKLDLTAGGAIVELLKWIADIGVTPESKHLEFDQHGIPLNDISSGLTPRAILSDSIFTEIFGWPGHIVALVKDAYKLQDLIEHLSEVDDMWLYLFPYDFRYSVSHTADLLSVQVSEIKHATGAPQVNMVAHSMGGLIAKEYLTRELAANNVNTLVMIGTPHLGAPAILKAMRYGDDMDISAFDPYKIKRLTRNMPSAYNLLPGEEYYRLAGSAFKDSVCGRGWLNGLGLHDFLHSCEESHTHYYPMPEDVSPRSTFSSTLLSHDFVEFTERRDTWEKPVRVNVYMIAGYGSPTIARLKEYEGIDYAGARRACQGTVSLYESCTAAWHPRRLLDVYPADGDATVPLLSARTTELDAIYYVKATHTGMLSKGDVFRQVEGLLTKGRGVYGSGISLSAPRRGKGWAEYTVRSPATLMVFDVEGRQSGVSIDGKRIVNIPESLVVRTGHEIRVIIAEDLPFAVELHGVADGYCRVEAALFSEDAFELERAVWEGVEVTSASYGMIELSANPAEMVLRVDTSAEGLWNYESLPDADGDGVPDAFDEFPNTPPGQIVGPTGGSISQLVPLSGPLEGGSWKNRGEFVSAVARTAAAFYAEGLISEDDVGWIVAEAARITITR